MGETTREVFLVLLGWFTFSFILLALWVVTGAVYSWRRRRALRRRYKEAAIGRRGDLDGQERVLRVVGGGSRGPAPIADRRLP